MALDILLLRWLEIVVAGIIIAGAMKSAYNGFISRMITNVNRVENIDRRTQAMEQRQGNIAEGLVAVAYVIDDGEGGSQVDAERVEQEVGVEQNVGKYVNSDDCDGTIPDFYRSSDPPDDERAS